MRVSEVRQTRGDEGVFRPQGLLAYRQPPFQQWYGTGGLVTVAIQGAQTVECVSEVQLNWLFSPLFQSDRPAKQPFSLEESALDTKQISEVI